MGVALRDKAAGLMAEATGLVERLPALPGAGEGPAPGAGEPPAPAAPAPEVILPVRGKLLYDYGWLPQGQEPHGGLDFAAAVGDPVLAIADGTVLRVAEDPALGGLVEVDHGFIIALYGQVAGSKVKAGEPVARGQALAAIAEPTGKEGDREAHLHLEVRITPGAKPVDPAPFLPRSAAPQGGDAD
jgi:murein DD-endopeptidase MepM/ murein hydrolase activator NlpD